VVVESRPRAAVLILGPTGSGKTPLGELLETEGLWGRRCIHFDFGANLRACAEGRSGGGLLACDEVEFLQRVIAEGALLEDEQFPIAKKIFDACFAASGAEDDALVVLNGLPRHAGQARAMEAFVDVRAVIQLECPVEAVVARIRTDVGGDRGGRSDDATDDVLKRVETYAERTAPLVAHYRERGVRVLCVPVGAGTTADDVRALLEAGSSPA
jgi:adenylate kinase